MTRYGRKEQLESLVDRAEREEAVRKLLEELKKIEPAIDDSDEFDAPNLKLPYAAADDEFGANPIWK